MKQRDVVGCRDNLKDLVRDFSLNNQLSKSLTGALDIKRLWSIYGCKALYGSFLIKETTEDSLKRCCLIKSNEL
jgi:hypothetical protein